MAQTLLTERARQVLRVDEEKFRKLVKRLARNAFIAEYHIRRSRLGFTNIFLGPARPGGWRYEATAESPLCRERFGDGRADIYIDTYDNFYLSLWFKCRADRPSSPAIRSDIAHIMYNGQFAASPWHLYNLYTRLYRVFGVGARPLLELARKAEEEGDREVAGILRRLYALLEASKDIVEEIEQADYSGVKAEVLREAEREAVKSTEEAVRLLREAKELARKGETKGLTNLIYSRPALLRPISLAEIIDYLDTGVGALVRNLLALDTGDLDKVLKEADIYDTIITVAEHFGLEVRR